LTGCKNFSRARAAAGGLVEARDWKVTLHVTQGFAAEAKHIAIRAHHIRISAVEGNLAQGRQNVFPCWLAAMTETPFRVTLDLRIGGPPAGSADFHLQAEVFKQEWEAFHTLAQPWQVELSPDRLFLLPD
jgi:molybdate transport system permease protein